MGGTNWATGTLSVDRPSTPLETARARLETSSARQYLSKVWKDTWRSHDQPRVWATVAALVHHKWLKATGCDVPVEHIAVVPNEAKDGYKVLLGENVNVLVLDELDEDEDLPQDACNCSEARRDG